MGSDDIPKGMDFSAAPLRPPAPPPSADDHAIRYGVLDILATLIVFAIHLGLMNRFFVERGPHYEQTQRMFAAAAISAGFAFGAAYLSFRFATKKGVSTFGWRLAFLICIDLVLVAISLVVCAAVYNFPLTLFLTVLFAIFCAPIVLLNPSRRKK